jgi:hypothetical protein
VGGGVQGWVGLEITHGAKRRSLPCSGETSPQSRPNWDFSEAGVGGPGGEELHLLTFKFFLGTNPKE